MRSRDAWLLATVFLVAGVVLVLLTFTGGGGGMMGGMMGGAMVGMALVGLVFLVAIVFLVVALTGVAGGTTAVPVSYPVYPPTAPLAAPAGPQPVSSEVEAAVIRLLDEDERLLYLRIRDGGGEALQKDIVAWGTFSAAKVTRLLDRLEGKGLLVRERHGMTNRIRLLRETPVSAK